MGVAPLTNIRQVTEGKVLQQFSSYLHGCFVPCNMHDLLNQTAEVFLVYSASDFQSLRALQTNADTKICKVWRRSYMEFSL